MGSKEGDNGVGVGGRYREEKLRGMEGASIEEVWRLSAGFESVGAKREDVGGEAGFEKIGFIRGHN